jgi:hypothetical protein
MTVAGTGTRVEMEQKDFKNITMPHSCITFDRNRLGSTEAKARARTIGTPRKVALFGIASEI